VCVGMCICMRMCIHDPRPLIVVCAHLNMLGKGNKHYINLFIVEFDGFISV
jgi:hypothetical protein